MKSEALDVTAVGVKGNVGLRKQSNMLTGNTLCRRPEPAASRGRKQGSKTNSLVKDHDHEMQKYHKGGGNEGGKKIV